MDNQPNLEELTPPQREAQRQLREFNKWKDDPHTKELIELLTREGIGVMTGALRFPTNLPDFFAREQELGEARGLLEAARVVKQKGEFLRELRDTPEDELVNQPKQTQAEWMSKILEDTIRTEL